MQKSESMLLNGMHEILRALEIRTDHLIPIRRPDIMINNKKRKKKKIKRERTCRIMEFALPADLRVKIKESEKRD